MNAGRQRSEFFLRLALVVASMAFAVVLLEIPALIHAVDYRTIIGHNSQWWPRNNVADPQLIHIRRPYSHLSGSAKGGLIMLRYRIPPSDRTNFQWNVRYDRNGFRNARDLNAASVIVIGDSFVEGMTVPDADLTTTRLGRMQDLTVANLGQPGYGPQQELIVLQRYGLPLRPRQVIWMFFEGNDLSDVRQYQQMLKPPGFWSDLMARSFTRNTLQFLYQYIQPSGARISAVVPGPQGKSRVYFSDVDSFSAQPLTGDTLQALDETGRVLGKAFALSAAQGARFMFVFVPDKFRVLQPSARFPKESECGTWRTNDLPERMRDVARRISPAMGFLDLTPDLMAAAKNGSLSYYPDDPHWTPEGHRIAANAIDRYLDATRISSKGAGDGLAGQPSGIAARKSVSR